MLTRALFALALICGMAATAAAEDTKVLALGIADHEATTAELETGAAVPAPHFNTAAIAYVLAAGLKKGDIVEIALVNGETPLLRNTATLAEDQGRFLLQAGKRGVPAGGWPEGTYHAKLTITRDGKTLIDQSSKPIAFE
jgi:hypothetical protein